MMASSETHLFTELLALGAPGASGIKKGGFLREEGMGGSPCLGTVGDRAFLA